LPPIQVFAIELLGFGDSTGFQHDYGGRRLLISTHQHRKRLLRILRIEVHNDVDVGKPHIVGVGCQLADHFGRAFSAIDADVEAFRPVVAFRSATKKALCVAPGIQSSVKRILVSALAA